MPRRRKNTKTTISDDERKFFESPPRKARHRLVGGSIGCLTISLLFLIICMLIGQVPDRLELVLQGHHTTGTVLSSDTYRTSFTDYRYTVGGRLYGGSSFGYARVGSRITVTYLPDKPQVSTMGTANIRWLAVNTFVYAFPGLLLVIGMARQALDIRRSLYLARYGIAVKGRVSKVVHTTSGTRSSGMQRKTTACYEFEVQDGRICRGRVRVYRRLPLRNGKTVTVMYDPRNPYRNQLLCLMMDIEIC